MGSQTPPRSFPPPPVLGEYGEPQVTLELPVADNRPHRYFVLPNGIEAIVISDELADKAAASITVEAGSMNDPEDLPGCAHFCEHLVLISSKNCQQWHFNAFTHQPFTRYYFDVAPHGLKEGLERTADLLLNPLFPASQVEREVNAIEAEFKMNFAHDGWKKIQLLHSLAKPGHKFNHFNIGNVETLARLPEKNGRSPRDELVAWHAANYCGRRIKAVVIGREDVDTLQSWVTSQFVAAPIKTQELPLTGPDAVFRSFDLPFGPEELSKVVFYQSVQKNRTVSIFIPIPDVRHLYRTKPFQFILYLVGYEGSGSILASLRERGWATSLGASIEDDVPGFGVLGVDITLTPNGLKHWAEASALAFDYFRLLRQQSHNLEQPFEDNRQLSNLKFKYSQKKHNAAYVGQLVKRLRRPVPRSKVLSSATVFGEYNSTLIETALEYLQVDKAIVLVESPELPVNGPLTLDTIEPYSRSQYTLDNLPKFVKLGDTVDPTLHLPSPNPFIPRTFDIPAGTVSAAPLLLSESVTSRLWYKKDTTFLLPKSSIRIKLKSPLVSVSPRGAALSLLFLELFAHAFSTEADDANLAGLSYATARVHDTLRFHLSGFTDKLGFFVARVISTLLNFEVDPATFANISDQLRQDLKNELFQPPYRVAFRKSFHALVENSWAHEEVLQELENVKVTDVAVFRAELFARLHIETFVYGGISDDDAIELHSDVEKAISSAALTPSEKGGPPRSLLLPKGYEGTWELPHAHGEEPNNAVVYNLYTPTGVEDRRTRLLTAFVAKVAEAPFFSILRTQEQLGYAVFVHYTGEGSLACFKAYIQSDRETAFIESRITDFLDNTLGGILKDLTDDDFGKYVQGVVGELEERPPNPKEEEQRLWGAISDRYYAFDRRATDAALLRTITKDEVLDYYHRYIHSSSKERRKLVLYLRSQKTAPAEVKSGEKIGDFAAFKHGLVAAKRAAPVKPLAEYAKRSGGA